MQQTNSLIEQLFSAGAHLGYGPSRRHPAASKYIFGAKGGVELIDLEQTAMLLERALQFIEQQGKDHKTILFVSGKAEARGAVERSAMRLGQPYVAGRWVGGTLTNFSEIRKRLERLAEIETMHATGEIAKFTKHERLLIDRDRTNLERLYGGLRGMSALPQVLVVIDPRAEHTAVTEAGKLNIPVVALLNTDCDTTGITYPIPGNDASRHSIELILEEVAKAYEKGLVQTAKPIEQNA